MQTDINLKYVPTYRLPTTLSCDATTVATTERLVCGNKQTARRLAPKKKIIGRRARFEAYEKKEGESQILLPYEWASDSDPATAVGDGCASALPAAAPGLRTSEIIKVLTVGKESQGSQPQLGFLRSHA